MKKETIKEKEYFFLLYFDKLKEIEEQSEIIFKSQEKYTHCILSKIIKSKEGKSKKKSF